MEYLEVKEKLGNYQNLVFNGFNAIDNAQKFGKSGELELSILISDIIAEIPNKNFKDDLVKIAKDVELERKRITTYLLYHHSRKDYGEGQPEDWKFWSNKHIAQAINDHMRNYKISKVQEVKNIILNDLKKEGLLLTDLKNTTSDMVR